MPTNATQWRLRRRTPILHSDTLFLTVTPTLPAMHRPRYCLFSLALFTFLLAPPAVAQDRGVPTLDRPNESATLSTRRPVATYSIVARDSATGRLGVAVQSHWFSVGSIVPWAKPGVGAVATQSFVDPRYGPLGLKLMRHGRTAEEALKALVTTDDGRAVRQVAMVDDDGTVAAHTGTNAVAAAGHHTGAQYSVQANMMANDEVWPAMAGAYETADGDLAALEAAQNAGGDIRGKQSAALLVVRDSATGESWNDRLFDLRIQDHATPVQELRRLTRMQRAYRALNQGDEHVTGGDVDAAMRSYRRAMDIVPDAATNGEAPSGWASRSPTKGASTTRFRTCAAPTGSTRTGHEWSPAFPTPASSGATTSPSASWRP